MCLALGFARYLGERHEAARKLVETRACHGDQNREIRPRLLRGGLARAPVHHEARDRRPRRCGRRFGCDLGRPLDDAPGARLGRPRLRPRRLLRLRHDLLADARAAAASTASRRPPPRAPPVVGLQRRLHEQRRRAPEPGDGRVGRRRGRGERPRHLPRQGQPRRRARGRLGLPVDGARGPGDVVPAGRARHGRRRVRRHGRLLHGLHPVRRHDARQHARHVRGQERLRRQDRDGPRGTRTFDARVRDGFDASASGPLRDLDESRRFVPTSAESTAM